MRSGFLPLKISDLPPEVLKSQSLLNEVWFPTKRFYDTIATFLIKSQSLLNEVWFPTKKFGVV